MNRLFNAQNYPTTGKAYLRWVNASNYSFEDEQGNTITAAQALIRGDLGVKFANYFMTQGETEGNYAAFSQSGGGKLLTLRERSVRVPNISAYDGTLLTRTTPDIWKAAFSEGSPVYQFTISSSGVVTATTLYSQGYRTNLMTIVEDDVSSEWTLSDNTGNVQRDTARFIEDLLKLLNPLTSSIRDGVGRCKYQYYSEQTASSAFIPFLVHYMNVVDEAEAVLVTEMKSVSGALCWGSMDLDSPTYLTMTEELFGPTEYLAPYRGYTESNPLKLNASSTATYVDIPYSYFLSKGVMGSVDLDWLGSTNILSVKLLNLESKPTIRITFNPGTTSINVAIYLNNLKDYNWPDRPALNSEVYVVVTRS